jgi:hypothetical protein
MITSYTENQKRLVETLKSTWSYKSDDPFDTYYERRTALESFLLSPDSTTNCGCGNPDETLKFVLTALDYCALDELDERKGFLQEKLGVEYVSDNGLVQLLFYVLNDKGYTQHGGGINGSWLTDAGKVFRALLKMYFNEPDADQMLNWEFDIDFNAIIAAD